MLEEGWTEGSLGTVEVSLFDCGGHFLEDIYRVSWTVLTQLEEDFSQVIEHSSAMLSTTGLLEVGPAVVECQPL